MSNNPLVFYWRDGRQEHGKNMAIQHFPDGEYSMELGVLGPKAFNDKIHIRIQGSCHDALSSEILLATAYEIAAQNPLSLTIRNTYFRHARSDRSVNGEACLAKFQARLWSGLGHVYPGVRLEFVDLHKDVILNYFEGPVFCKNLTVLPELLREAQRGSPTWSKDTNMDKVFATVDEGMAHYVKRMFPSQDSGIGFASISKQRLSGSETKVLSVTGSPMEGRDVYIIDDMIATGGSMLHAAEAYHRMGARHIYAVAAHGVFAEGYKANMASELFDRIYVSDSHPGAQQAKATLGDKLKVLRLNTLIS